MRTVDFEKKHIAQAKALALAVYEEERRRVPALPPAESVPDLGYFADNGLGAAALDGGTLVGFLCAAGPFDNAFGSTDARGVFSPMGANAAMPRDRARIYAALYQFAARKWVHAGAVSHGICLYAHDETAQRQFFQYGFGMRCVDAVRTMERISCTRCGGYTFAELPPDSCAAVYPLEQSLNRHYHESPFFMNRPLESCAAFCETIQKERERCFIAQVQGTTCAYLKLSKAGETFITKQQPYRHITGAFCLPDHRGQDVMQNLLNFVMESLQKEGVCYLGVDYESLNPGASAFWQKYFTSYTHGVVRRVDERILEDITS